MSKKMIIATFVVLFFSPIQSVIEKSQNSNSHYEEGDPVQDACDQEAVKVKQRVASRRKHKNSKRKEFDDGLPCLSEVVMQHIILPEDQDPIMSNIILRDAPVEILSAVHMLKMVNENLKHVLSDAEVPKQFILHGPPGSGKSALARAIAWKLARPCLSLKASQLVNEYQNSGASNAKSFIGPVLGLKKPVVCVIEEVTAVTCNNNPGDHQGDAAAHVLGDFIDECEKRRDVLFIGTTNIPDALPPAFKDRVGCRFYLIEKLNTEQQLSRFNDMIKANRHFVLDVACDERYLKQDVGPHLRDHTLRRIIGLVGKIKERAIYRASVADDCVFPVRIMVEDINHEVARSLKITDDIIKPNENQLSPAEKMHKEALGLQEKLLEEHRQGRKEQREQYSAQLAFDYGAAIGGVMGGTVGGPVGAAVGGAAGSLVVSAVRSLYVHRNDVGRIFQRQVSRLNSILRHEKQ